MTGKKFTGFHGVLLVLALVFALFPVFWLLSTAFKPWHEFTTGRQRSVSEISAFTPRAEQMVFPPSG